jgi:hypothetical protein
MDKSRNKKTTDPDPRVIADLVRTMHSAQRRHGVRRWYREMSSFIEAHGWIISFPILRLDPIGDGLFEYIRNTVIAASILMKVMRREPLTVEETTILDEAGGAKVIRARIAPTHSVVLSSVENGIPRVDFVRKTQ